jgi:hypothetical protein
MSKVVRQQDLAQAEPDPDDARIPEKILLTGERLKFKLEGEGQSSHVVSVAIAVTLFALVGHFALGMNGIVSTLISLVIVTVIQHPIPTPNVLLKIGGRLVKKSTDK